MIPKGGGVATYPTGGGGLKEPPDKGAPQEKNGIREPPWFSGSKCCPAVTDGPGPPRVKKEPHQRKRPGSFIKPIEKHSSEN